MDTLPGANNGQLLSSVGFKLMVMADPYYEATWTKSRASLCSFVYLALKFYPTFTSWFCYLCALFSKHFAALFLRFYRPTLFNLTGVTSDWVSSRQKIGLRSPVSQWVMRAQQVNNGRKTKAGVRRASGHPAGPLRKPMSTRNGFLLLCEAKSERRSHFLFFTFFKIEEAINYKTPNADTLSILIFL